MGHDGGETQRLGLLNIYVTLGRTNTFLPLFMKEKRLRPLLKCRFDEVAPLARLLWASYQRDKADFVDLLPEDYTADFGTDFTKKLEAVDKLVASSVQQAKGMVFTAEIEALYEALPELLNRLEARVRRAGGLTVPTKKFGIGEAREARNQGDKEDLAGDLKTLLQNVAANQEALAKKGQQPTDTQKLQALYDALVDSGTSQGANTSTQRQLTQANVQTINALETLMQHLFDDGKSLYERSDKTRLKDYTYKQLLKLVRRERAGQAETAG